MANLRYDIKKESFITVPELVYMGRSIYEHDWKSIMHSHSITELIYVISGRGELRTTSAIYKIEARDFLIIPPHLIHTEVSSENSPLEYFVLGVSNIYISLYKDTENYNPKVDLGSNNDRVRLIIEKIESEVSKRRIGYEISSEASLLNIVVILQRSPGFSALFENTQPAKAKLANIKDYLDSHYVEEVNLRLLEDMFNISKYHMVREFKKAFNVSPMVYLEEKRMREAKNLLINTELRVTDISSLLGYSSSSYFTHRFKTHNEGMTPLEYRNNTK